MPQKVDNDLESSNLGFSDGHSLVDEHAYQIGELGEFNFEKSLSDELEGINREQSVEFSEGSGGLSVDLGNLSREADYDSSSLSSSAANEVTDEDDSFYSSSMYKSEDEERHARSIQE